MQVRHDTHSPTVSQAVANTHTHTHTHTREVGEFVEIEVSYGSVFMTVKEKVHDKPHARFCMFFCSFLSHQQMSLLITDCEMQHMLALVTQMLSIGDAGRLFNSREGFSSTLCLHTELGSLLRP